MRCNKIVIFNEKAREEAWIRCRFRNMNKLMKEIYLQDIVVNNETVIRVKYLERTESRVIIYTQTDCWKDVTE